MSDIMEIYIFNIFSYNKHKNRIVQVIDYFFKYFYKNRVVGKEVSKNFYHRALK